MTDRHAPPADQLSLALEAGRPRLPAMLRPMLHRGECLPFDSAEHLFEPVWGGARALALVESGLPAGRPGVDLLDRLGRPLHRPPELDDLGARVRAGSAVLDGELVAVGRDGRSDAAGLRARLRGDPGPALAYLVFDLLHVDGRPVVGLPLERRRELLQRILVPGDSVVAVPAIVSDGVALHAAVVAQGLAGVMARQRRSPYLPGVRSRLWRFVPASPSEPDGSRLGPGVDAVPSTGPILALIRRLPLGDD